MAIFMVHLMIVITDQEDQSTMKWKRRGRKWLWPNLRYHPSICLEKLRGKKLSW
jgi:hypothetical protein